MTASDLPQGELKQKLDRQMRNIARMPVIVLTTHVDDLKLAGFPEMIERTRDILTKELGKLTWRPMTSSIQEFD
eukprot:213756-Amphidinium_carterae.1